MKEIVGNKIVLIGAGDVGVAYAYAVVNQGLCDHLAIIDIDQAKTEANVQDLNHGMPWAPTNTRVTSGSYEKDIEDAALVVICAGAAQKPGETRLDLVGKNMKIFHSIVTEVMKHNFGGIFLIATNPVDILSYATWRFSGLPSNQVIGSGTILDTARYRYMLGRHFKVSPMSVHAAIIGEHGDSELPAVSAANIAGVPLSKFVEEDPALPEVLEEIFVNTRDAAYKIIEAKGSTSYGIGMGLARITRAILQNQGASVPVSTLLNGEYGHDDIYIGTPAVVGRHGVERVIELDLNEQEQERFDNSANTLEAIQKEFFTDSKYTG